MAEDTPRPAQAAIRTDLGAIFVSHRPSFTGPYTVRSDCTGFLDYTTNLTDPSHTVHGEFVIVDDGKEFFVLDDEDGWQASGIGKRL